MGCRYSKFTKSQKRKYRDHVRSRDIFDSDVNVEPQYNIRESKNEIDEMGRKLRSQQAVIEENNDFIQCQAESIIIQDQDIRNLQEALRERDLILKGVKWALNLTMEPCSPIPFICSKRNEKIQQVNQPNNDIKNSMSSSHSDCSKDASEDVII